MILVVGATGILGGAITFQLLGKSQEVRILLRHDSPSEHLAKQGMATSSKSLLEAGAQPVYGDLKDPPSLARACKGIETIITTANSAMRGGDDTVETVDRQGNRNLIEAAKAAHVKQFIFISFLGASPDNPVPLFQAKAETEATLAKSGMTYTILAPNFFMESWIGMVVGIPLQARLPITLVGQGQRLHSLISISDVAAFTVSAVGHPAAMNQRLTLGGPEPISWCGIVDSFSQVLRQQLPVQFVPPGQAIPGLPEIVPPVLAGMEAYDSPVPMEQIAGAFGVKQIPLKAFIHSMLNIPVG